MLAAFLVITLVVALIVFSLISQSGRPRRRPSRGHTKSHHPLQSMSRGQISTRWQTILAMSAGGGNGLRQAISEADKLFDQVLRQQGISGEFMGDRLKSAKPRFSDYAVYDGVWRAHKLRNALAHEVGFDLVASQAHEALQNFERGLKALGAL